MLPSLGSTKRFEYDGTFGGLRLSSFGMLEKKPIAPSSQAAAQFHRGSGADHAGRPEPALP